MHREITHRGVSTTVLSFDKQRTFLVVKDEGFETVYRPRIFVAEIEPLSGNSMFVSANFTHAALVEMLYEKFKCSKETIERIIFAIRQV